MNAPDQTLLSLLRRDRRLGIQSDSSSIVSPLSLSLLAMLMALVAGLVLPMLPDSRNSRLSAGVAIVVAYVFFCGRFVLQHRQLQQQAKRNNFSHDAKQDASDVQPVLIACASQTGYADQLAQQTAGALEAAGMAVRVLPLALLDAALMRQSRQILFIISTSGEGDAPDNATAFVRTLMAHSLALPHLQYAILALGDRHYQHYCAFGHRLQHWLQQQQAQAMFDLLEVDNGEQKALHHWQTQLGTLSGQRSMASWISPGYHHWTLTERRLLNPGSSGAPVFHLALAASDTAVCWQAGDIAEIGPMNALPAVEHYLAQAALPGDALVRIGQQSCSLREHLRSRLLLPEAMITMAKLTEKLAAAQALADALPALPARAYSIASVSSDGQLELLVRQVRQADGQLGLGSGWLTQHAVCGSQIALRVRDNRSFHAPPDDRPLILIGNGTGLAGLRAHLKQRQQRGQQRNWLFFGERSAQHDYFYQEEIRQWQASGLLQGCDIVFSRDQAQRLYVQDQLACHADRIQRWVAAGAAIYVCGSKEGMAAAVTAQLGAILGQEQLEKMKEQGDYRRDVY
ncbi:sulfite reductase flavoprotein subunit alpha [soil metagenome]